MISFKKNLEGRACAMEHAQRILCDAFPNAQFQTHAAGLKGLKHGFLNLFKGIKNTVAGKTDYIIHVNDDTIEVKYNRISANEATREPRLLGYEELKREIVRYSENPILCSNERDRLREMVHNYLLKRAEEVKRLPTDQQAGKMKKLGKELKEIIQTKKSGQNIRSAIQEAISHMGNNDKLHLLECDENL